MWVGFVCFHPVLAIKIHCSGPISLTVNILCWMWRLYSIFYNMQKNILFCSNICILRSCIHLCECACVVSVLGSFC